VNVEKNLRRHTVCGIFPGSVKQQQLTGWVATLLQAQGLITTALKEMSTASPGLSVGN
jgi:hypothetical protein